MPTYDYECGKCGHKFEAFQSITADALKKCPECGKNGLQRLIGAGAGIIFRGSGFYITDYKKRSSSAGSSPSKPSGDKPSSSSSEGSTKSDSSS
jgi:putative FmdB family regulatory protein